MERRLGKPSALEKLGCIGLGVSIVGITSLAYNSEYFQSVAICAGAVAAFTLPLNLFNILRLGVEESREEDRETLNWIRCVCVGGGFLGGIAGAGYALETANRSLNVYNMLGGAVLGATLIASSLFGVPKGLSYLFSKK